MPKNRLFVFIAFVLVLLIIAGLSAWFTNEKTADEPEASTAPAASDTPEQTQTPSSAPESTPEPTPEPTPEETLDPSVPATRNVSLSGDFSSATGTNLNIGVKWTAVSRNDEIIRLNVDVYLYSYTMHCGSVGGSVSVNGESRNFVSNAISYDNTDKLQALKLYSMSVDLPIAVGETVSIPISAAWNFSGEYNGQPIDGVAVDQYIQITG